MPRRSQGQSVLHSFPESGSCPQSCQAQLNPQRGSSVSPTGALALATPLSTGWGRDWNAVFCPLPAPGSSFSFTPLTHPPQPQHLSGRSRAEMLGEHLAQSRHGALSGSPAPSPGKRGDSGASSGEQIGSQWVLPSPCPRLPGRAVLAGWSHQDGCPFGSAVGAGRQDCLGMAEGLTGLLEVRQ